MPVLITFDFPPRIGGIQRYCASLAAALHAGGHAVAVVAPASAGAREHDARLDLPVFRFTGSTRIGRIVAAKRALALARAAVDDGFTIAGSWLPAGLIAAYAPGRAGGHLTVLAHGTEIRPHGPPWRVGLLRTVAARADLIAANSRCTADLLRSAGVRRDVAVLNCGVEARPLVRRPASVPTILSVGRLVPRKGFDRVIQALPALRERIPQVRYVVAGDGPYRTALEAETARLGVADRVAFLGAVDDAALREAYAQAWCFAMPARSVGDDTEGFGIVYLEAAMAGLPSVGGRETGAEDAIVDGHTGLLTDGNDPRSIGLALETLLCDRARAAAFGSAARARALAHFAWPNIARELAALTGMQPLAQQCSA